MYETVDQLPDNIQADCTPDEQVEYLRVFNSVFEQTKAADMAAAAAWGAVKKMRMVGVSVMKSAPNGDLEIAGWAMKFLPRRPAEEEKDLYQTYFSTASSLLLEYYQGAPLWMEHGLDPDYGVKPIGRRSLVQIYGHGVWMGHGVHSNHERFDETKRDLDNGEFSYSSDSIGHYVEEGFNPVDGHMGAWPFAGCSLTRSPAEPALGPTLPSFSTFFEALKSSVEHKKQTESEAREARRSGERKPFFLSDMRGVKSIMTPEQLAAIAQFLGCEATPEAVLAALQQLISQLQAAPEPAADGTGGDPAAMTMMSNIGGAMGLPATAGKSEVIAKLNDIVTILKAPPTKKLDFAALKRFVAGVEASLEEPEEDDIPYFTGDDNSDDDDAPVRYSSGRSNGQGKRDRQVGFRHARGAAKPGLIDVVAAITQLQAGPVQFEMPAFKSKRTSPKAALRSMNINNASNGGWRLNRELSGELLEALYAELVFEKLGVKVVPMDGIESLTMNRVQSGAVAYWAGTGQTVTDANAKLQAAVTLQTKELISKAIIENKLLNNSVGTEAMVQEDILKVMKLRLELAGLYGTGSVPLAAGNTGAEPLGLKSITGVTSTSLASKSPTIDDMINAEGRIEDANYDYTDLKWLSSGRARRYFKKMKDTKGLPLFDEDWMTTDIKALMVNDHPFLTTTQVPNTTVDSVVTTDIFLADWNAMLLGQGLDLDMVVDTSRYVEERSTLIQVVSYADFGLAYKEAIQILTLAKV